jgi:hypothetical protein
MTITRRGFLGAILAAGVAPAIIRSTSLMPLWVPRDTATWFDEQAGANALQEEWSWTEEGGAELREAQSISKRFIAQVTGLYDVTVADDRTGLSTVHRKSLVAGDTVRARIPDRESLTDIKLISADEPRTQLVKLIKL